MAKKPGKVTVKVKVKGGGLSPETWTRIQFLILAIHELVDNERG